MEWSLPAWRGKTQQKNDYIGFSSLKQFISYPSKTGTKASSTQGQDFLTYVSIFLRLLTWFVPAK